jgi:hypothetical protein
VDDFVADVFIQGDPKGPAPLTACLLEINPSCLATDACLFNWRKENDFDGSFRYRS